MPTSRPTLQQIVSAIDERLTSPVTLDDLAEALGCSRSSIQRACRPWNFTMVLRRRRAIRAAKAIVHGKTVTEAAALAGVSTDQLRRIFVDVHGVRPGDLREAVIQMRRVALWKSRPPRPGTRLYYRRLRQWRRTERLFDRLRMEVKKSTPLEQWLVDSQEASRRPDFRERPYRQALREQRRAEKQRRDELIDQLLRQAAERVRASQP